jgi:hypothetical protein
MTKISILQTTTSALQKFETNIQNLTQIAKQEQIWTKLFYRNSDHTHTCTGDVAGYCHMTEWLQTGFGLIFGFTELLQSIITSNYSVITNSLTLWYNLRVDHIANTTYNITSIVACMLLPSNGSSCCSAMAIVLLFVSRSLPSNGSICHNFSLLEALHPK